ncbi:MAG: NfeD family protein [Burkholderiaceae bacterium]
MDWPASTWWWIIAGLLVAGELATGTFYLLMVAFGGAAAAIAAQLGGGEGMQVAAAGIVGGGAVIAWHRRQRARPRGPAPEADRDVNLDVGERVQVAAWNPDGTARVQYRGAAWNVRFVGDGPPTAGAHVIDEVRHNELALRRAD